MTRVSQALLLFPTEAAAHKAAAEQCRDLRSPLVRLQLYALRPAAVKKPVYLLSRSQRLTRAELAWIEEQQATVNKSGRFQTGLPFLPLQRRMVRTREAHPVSS